MNSKRDRKVDHYRHGEFQISFCLLSTRTILSAQANVLKSSRYTRAVSGYPETAQAFKIGKKASGFLVLLLLQELFRQFNLNVNIT
jgi:hypothetical protein